MSDQPHDEPSGVIAPPPGNRFTVRVERHQLVNAYGELDAATGVLFAAALSPLAADGGVIGVNLSALDFWVPPGSNVLFGAVQRHGTRGGIVIYDPAPSVSQSSPSPELTASSKAYAAASAPHRPLGRLAPSPNIADAVTTPPTGQIESPDVDPEPCPHPGLRRPSLEEDR